MGEIVISLGDMAPLLVGQNNHDAFKYPNNLRRIFIKYMIFKVNIALVYLHHERIPVSA